MFMCTHINEAELFTNAENKPPAHSWHIHYFSQTQSRNTSLRLKKSVAWQPADQYDLLKHTIKPHTKGNLDRSVIPISDDTHTSIYITCYLFQFEMTFSPYKRGFSL